jgi:hypothetical protein
MLDSVMDQPFLTASMMPTVDEKPLVGTSRWQPREISKPVLVARRVPFRAAAVPRAGHARTRRRRAVIEESKIWPAHVLVVNYWNGS